MEITEKDIFYFVFAPDKLEKEKFFHIRKNINYYEKEIQMLQEIKQSLNNRIDPDILHKIEKKIELFKTENEIELNKFKYIHKKYSDYFTLAADNGKEIDKKKVSVDTFIDENSNYFVKIINMPDKKKVMLFEKGNEIINDFTLQILPSNVIFEHVNNEKPLILKSTEKIEKLILTIH